MENCLTLKFEFEKRNIERTSSSGFSSTSRGKGIAMLSKACVLYVSRTQRQDASWSLCIQCKEKGGDGRGRVRVRHKGIVTKSK